LSQETVEGGSTGKAREIFYTYDTRGNMLSRRDWHDRGSDPTVNLTPDAYGNLQSFTDARGYTTSISYDTTHTYPAVITYPATDDGKSHIVRYEAWDYRFGKVKTRRDERSYATQFDYDVFGRIEQVDYPDGGQVVTEYYDSPNPRYTLTRTKESAGSFIDAYTYRDGLDREVQRVSFGEGGKSIVFETLYDNMGRVDMVYGPFFGSGSGYPKSPPGSSPYTDTAYDYQGRPTSVTSPDGTYNQRKGRKEPIGRIVLMPLHWKAAITWRGACPLVHQKRDVRFKSAIPDQSSGTPFSRKAVQRSR
jgi:hypothetical protein